MKFRIALGLAAATCLASVAQAETEAVVKVMLNHAHIMRLPAKTSTVVIGNPVVADISVQKNGIVVVTGKSFGTTNLIVLDAEGGIVSESLVAVTAPKTDDAILVQRGMTRETYSCNPSCQPSIQLGDTDEYFLKSGDLATRLRTLAAGGGAK